MSDEIPVEPHAEAAEEPVEGIVYVGEDGEAEMPFAEHLAENPDLQQVAVAAIRVEEDDETPPIPAFIVVPNKYGPGSHSVTLGNGEPLGVWFDREAPQATGAEIEMTLLEMGLAPEIAKWFGTHRDRRLAADAELASMPAVQSFAESERLHEEQTAPIREAFVKAQQGKKS